MKISFTGKKLPEEGAIAVAIFKGKKLSETASQIDELSNGAISRAIKASNSFEGKNEQLITIMTPEKTGLSRVVCIGLGDPKKVDELKMQDFGGRAATAFLKAKEKKAAIAVDSIKEAKTTSAELSSWAAYGAFLGSYSFDKYKTKKEDDIPPVKKIKIISASENSARKLFHEKQAVAEGVFFARDLVSEPANVIYPESFAKEAEKLSELGVKVEILDEYEMKKLGMNMLLAVGQGSKRESRLVVMKWDGTDSDKKPIAFVGKGVCFDSGGISIKPSNGMEEMKWDMAGAGTVTGLIKALAGRKAKINAVGVIGLVENMPSGSAQRPGDVVKSMSGKTVEVINTDAEGRLVLGDALWYTQERFKPAAMINLATLTGAMIISLGHQRAGLFSNNNKLAKKLFDAGQATGEKLWRLPLDKEYDALIKSDIADMKNLGGRGAGSITAAMFLKRFVKKTPWAHLDIAGMAWAKKSSPTVPKGASAFGVRLLDRFVSDNYEN